MACGSVRAYCTSVNADGGADMIWTLRVLSQYIPELLTAENIAGNMARWFVVNFKKISSTYV